MAYYDDAYMWAQEHNTSFPVAYQDPVSFSTYEPYGVDTNYDAYNGSVFHEPKSIDRSYYGNDYEHNSHYDYGNCRNWYLCANPAINYFAHNYMEPKLIAYEPVECDTGYVSYHTQYSVSYSKVDSGFNEPEFEEYDPTPYEGGFDIISTYGKPLPPSDQTCYPRSKPKPSGPRPTPSSESQPETEYPTNPMPVSAATSVPLVESEPKPKPEPQPEPIPMSISASIPQAEPEPEPEPEHTLVPVTDALGFKEPGEREREEYSYPGYGYDYPWPEYDNASAIGVGYDYGYGKQVVQIPPCEYSPDVVDLCESVFGNWPCLARIRKQQMGVDNSPGMGGPEIEHINPWEECASYIFGRHI